MRYVVRKGQRTYLGRTKAAILAEASELDARAWSYVGSAARELSSRDREKAAFLRHQAERMAG